MVQEFHVIRCVTCETFQVQQVKKATTRWSCRVCGEKQSLLKEFGRGSAADCRRHVQKLNAARGATLEEAEQNTWSLWEWDDEDEAREEGVQLTQTSRWTKYLDAPVEVEPEQEEEEGAVLMDRQQLLGNNRMHWCEPMNRTVNSGTVRDGSVRKRKREAADQNLTKPPSTRTQSRPRTAPSVEQFRPRTAPSVDQFRPRTAPSVDQSRPRTATSVDQSRPRTTDLNQSSQSRVTPPSLGSDSRWTRFFSLEPCVSGRSQQKCGVGDIISRPHPIRPASSMFETEEDFSIGDEEFLIDQ